MADLTAEQLPHDGPPADVADALEQAALWLEAYDRFCRPLLAGSDSATAVEGTEVQDFLVDLARWFRDRPDQAELAWASIGPR